MEKVNKDRQKDITGKKRKIKIEIEREKILIKYRKNEKKT